MRVSEWQLMPEEVLIDLCKVDFQEAWYEMDRRFWRAMEVYAGRLLVHAGCLDPQQASDVVQDAWLTKTHGPIYVLNLYKPARDGSLRRFLWHRVWSVVRHSLRYKRLRQRPETEWARQHNNVAPASEPQQIAEMVRALPPELTACEVEVTQNILQDSGDLTGVQPAALQKRLERMKPKFEAARRNQA